MKILYSLGMMALLASCAATPKSPEEAAARKAASMRYSTTQCTIYMGGISDIRSVLDAANAMEKRARALGATDAVMVKAQQDVEVTWGTGVALIGKQEMCSNMVSTVAANM